MGYIIQDIGGYSDSTLIVGVSNDESFLCIFFKYEIKDKNVLYISKIDPKIEHRYNIFYGLNDNSLGYTFIDMLVNYSKFSTIYNDSKIYSSVLKERDSINRLEKICNHYKISFE